jgi:hypothetical protein
MQTYRIWRNNLPSTLENAKSFEKRTLRMLLVPRRGRAHDHSISSEHAHRTGFH